MNNKQKQKANIAAAKLLGLEYSAKSIHKTHNGTWHIDMNVDIFTNPADCLAVVKVLGADNVVLFSDMTKGVLMWKARYWTGIYSKRFDTYEESVAAACLRKSSVA